MLERSKIPSSSRASLDIVVEFVMRKIAGQSLGTKE
jgi:hypothetical protein